VKLARLAVETRYFPIYEVEYGRVRINIKVDRPRPLEEFLKPQRRFAHLLNPENAHVLEALKRQVEENWERLVKLEESGVTI